jgi:hypothetical protein
MTHRSTAHRVATRRRFDREVAFDAALSAYQRGGNPEGLLRAAGAVIDSKIPIAPEHADRISEMTDQLNIEVETYGDAAYAVRRWLAVMRRPAQGVEHTLPARVWTR